MVEVRIARAFGAPKIQCVCLCLCLMALLARAQNDAPVRQAGVGKIVPVGPGRTVPAGPGEKTPADGHGRGRWRTYDATDGLAFGSLAGFAAGVVSIFEDREGRLWFGTYGGGVSLRTAARQIKAHKTIK